MNSFGTGCAGHTRARPRWGEAGYSLDFRQLPDVGADAFVNAIAATYEGTRDSWITRSIDERGRLGAAQADFVDYQGMEHLSEWWELAYADDGALAGVTMAARNPSTAVIAYVGVVPDQRGRGLATELVRRGTNAFLKAGRPRFAVTATATTSAWSKPSNARDTSSSLGDARTTGQSPETNVGSAEASVVAGEAIARRVPRSWRSSAYPRGPEPAGSDRNRRRAPCAPPDSSRCSAARASR